VYKQELKPEEQYHKPEIAMLMKLESMGFKFNLVLADSLYGESGKFISVLDELNLNYIGDSLKSFRRATSKTKIQYLKWHRFKRVFSDLTREYRFIREIIPGKEKKRYWQITVALPDHSTWYVMSRYPDITSREVGNTELG